MNDQVIIDKTNCHTDVARGPNSVDRKGLNCHDCKTRVHINKQNPDIAEDVADGVRVDKGDLDDISVVPQRQISMIQTVQEISQLQCIDKVIGDLVVQVPQTKIVEKTVEIPQLQTVEKITGTETSSLRQSAGMLQAREKQPESDVSGRVSESCGHFQFGAQFRDTADEHRNTHQQSMRNTCTEPRCRDNTNVTMTTDKRSNDDNNEEREQGEQGQGGTKAIFTRHRNRMQATTEQELRRLMEESTVYNGRIVTPETIKHLKNHAIVPRRGHFAGRRKEEGTEETGQR